MFWSLALFAVAASPFLFNEKEDHPFFDSTAGVLGERHDGDVLDINYRPC